MITTDRIEMNCRVIEEFRANSGKVQGWGPLILLTTRGAKTGQTRIYPLMSVPYGENYIAVASKGGAPKNPLWYNNLLAHPDVTVENGNETFAATCQIARMAMSGHRHLRRPFQSFHLTGNIKRERHAKSLFFYSNGMQTPDHNNTYCPGDSRNSNNARTIPGTIVGADYAL